jgi:hypothetical protein
MEPYPTVEEAELSRDYIVQRLREAPELMDRIGIIPAFLDAEHMNIMSLPELIDRFYGISPDNIAQAEELKRRRKSATAIASQYGLHPTTVNGIAQAGIEMIRTFYFPDVPGSITSKRVQEMFDNRMDMLKEKEFVMEVLESSDDYIANLLSVPTFNQYAPPAEVANLMDDVWQGNGIDVEAIPNLRDIFEKYYGINGQYYTFGEIGEGMGYKSKIVVSYKLQAAMILMQRYIAGDTSELPEGLDRRVRLEMNALEEKAKLLVQNGGQDFINTSTHPKIVTGFYTKAYIMGFSPSQIVEYLNVNLLSIRNKEYGNSELNPIRLKESLNYVFRGREMRTSKLHYADAAEVAAQLLENPRMENHRISMALDILYDIYDENSMEELTTRELTSSSDLEYGDVATLVKTARQELLASEFREEMLQLCDRVAGSRDIEKLTQNQRKLINRKLLPLYEKFRDSLQDKFSPYERTFIQSVAEGKTMDEITVSLDIPKNEVLTTYLILIRGGEYTGLHSEARRAEAAEVVRLFELKSGNIDFDKHFEDRGQYQMYLAVMRFRAAGHRVLDIAERLHISEVAVSRYASRARAIFRNYQENREVI